MMVQGTMYSRRQLLMKMHPATGVLFVVWILIIRGKTQEDLNEYALRSLSGGTPTEWPYLTADLPKMRFQKLLPWNKGISLCSWVWVESFKRPTIVFSAKDSESDNWQVILGMTANGFLISIDESVFTIRQDVFPATWNHICLVIAENHLSVYHAGQEINTSPLVDDPFTRNLTISLGGGTSVSSRTQRNDSVDEGFSTPRAAMTGSFSGKFLFPVLYGSKISEEVVSKLRNCQSIKDTILISSWKLVGEGISKKTETISNTPCLKRAFDYIFLSRAVNVQDNEELCKRLSLKMINQDTNESYSEIVKELEPYHKECGRGSWYVWLHPIDKSLGLDAKTNKACRALVSQGREEALECEGTLCSGCQIDDLPKIFVLRGLCTQKEKDFSFVIRRNNDKLGFFFCGFENYRIWQEGISWKLQDTETGSTLASTSDAHDPVGVKVWKTESDFCGRMSGDTLTLSLTSCGRDEAFCSDGSCIPLSSRCDSKSDCETGSDEENCGTIVVPKGYRNHLPPPPLPPLVNGVLNVIRIVSTPPEEYFTLLVDWKFEWKDARVKFANIPRDSGTFTVNHSLIWRPKLSVLAPDHSKAVQMMENDSNERAFYVPRVEGRTLMGRASGAPLQDSYDTLFDGTNVTLKLSELITQNVDCHFDFAFFPFDMHFCRVTFITNYGATTPGTGSFFARYTGPFRIYQYTVIHTHIKKVDLKVGTSDGYTGLIFTIGLERRSTLYVISIYLPTFILLMLNYGSLWMVGRNVVLVRFLVINTIILIFVIQWVFVAVSSPPVGYAVALDVWLCFCTSISILHLGILVLIEIFSSENKRRMPLSKRSSLTPSRVTEVKSIDSNSLNIYDNFINVLNEMDDKNQKMASFWILFIAKIVSPALLASFNIIYWPFVFYFRENRSL